MDNIVGVLTGNEEGDSYALALRVPLSRAPSLLGCHMLC